MRCLVFLFIVFLTACVTQPSRVSSEKKLALQPEIPMLDDSFFGEPQAIISVDKILSLTPEQKSKFFAHYNSAQYRALFPNKRISRYLTDQLKQFNFYSDTLTASEALSHNLGNCLSLAIVTKALANIVNVDIEYELVATPPIYQKEGDYVLSAQHVRTLLYDPKPGEIIGYNPLWRGFIRVDYFPAEGTRTLNKVDEDEFYSMYYRNKAAEALTSDNTDLAFWYLKKLLSSNKNDAGAINMLALLHKRLGYSDYAEKQFQYALRYSGESLELLNNYHILLKYLRRYDEADIIAKRMLKYKDPNPFKWVNLGITAYKAKDYTKAIHFFRKAIKLADYLHEPYAGISQVHYSRGNINLARRALKKAIENSHKKNTLSIYQAKYDHLTQLLNEKKR